MSNPVANATNDLEYLQLYLSACRVKLGECIDVVTHQETIQGVRATTRLHHIKFDGNGRPMIKALAECLYQHIEDYCIAARNRQEPLSNQDHARLVKEARKYFVHPPATPADPDQTGEAGECLLYMLMEVVLQAPQVVAKMELKTNPNDEVKGSDGIHMAWNDADNVVEIYFGEAKLHKGISGGLSSAFESIEAFHAERMDRHEFAMATKHFKYVDAKLQKAVEDLLRDGVPKSGVRIKHAILIGYNWQHYRANSALTGQALADDFRQRYVADARRIHDLIQTRFDGFSKKEIEFEVFFVPFESVQDLRDAFNEALD